LGDLDNLPTTQWFEAHDLTQCRVCRCTASSRINQGIHSTCWAKLRAEQDVDISELFDEDLPDFQEIMVSSVSTKDWIPKSLLPLARETYDALLKDILKHSREDAWEVGVGDCEETRARKAKARRVWLEFCMFGKTCLRTSKRGARHSESYRLTKRLLTRWKAGERLTLWSEIPEASTSKRKQPPLDSKQRTFNEVTKLVGKGKFSKAMQRLTSGGLAPETEEVRQNLLRKFPAFDWSQATEIFPDAPPPQLEAENVARAIRGLEDGVAPGPTGIRNDFLKQLLGKKEDDAIVATFTDFVQFLAEGKVPPEVRPWFFGGKLFGIAKEGADVSQDARPIIAGECWRKVAFKVSLSLDMDRIRRRLAPRQTAIGVSNGLETLCHGTRAWLSQAKLDTQKVLLKVDISNAYNAASPELFLRETLAHMPASACFAKSVYGQPSHLILHGRAEIGACQRGQQGCAGMSAMFCLLQKSMREEARGLAQELEYIAEYADDSLLGGNVQDVLRQFEAEMRVGQRYGLQINPAKCVLYLPSGADFQGDIQRFQQLGVTVKPHANMKFLQTIFTEDQAIADSFCEAKMRTLAEQFERLMEHPLLHVQLHLLRNCLGASKVGFLSRTTPGKHLQTLLAGFDSQRRQTLEALLADTLSEDQWQQAQLGINEGGLGMQDAKSLASAAFVASIRSTRRSVRELLDNTNPGISVFEVEALSELLPLASEDLKNQLADMDFVPSQKSLSKLQKGALRNALKGAASPTLKTRLDVFECPWSGSWLNVAPHAGLDTLLSNDVVRVALRTRLGCREFEQDTYCPMCVQILDSKGHHAHHCRAGGEGTKRHNDVRNFVHEECRKAGFQPELEKMGLLDNRRPADVLIHTGACKLSRDQKHDKVALDFAVISPFTPQRLREGKPCLDAAASYANSKREHQNTERQLEEKNISFEPVVFLTTGGVDSDARRVLEKIAEEIARRTHDDRGSVLGRIRTRISIILARSLQASIEKRRNLESCREDSEKGLFKEFWKSPD
jgi:hypothetical protein